MAAGAPYGGAPCHGTNGTMVNPALHRRQSWGLGWSRPPQILDRGVVGVAGGSCGIEDGS